MIYSYIIDNNEDYPEDHSFVELLSTQKISFTEFKNVVKDAYQLCGGEDVYFNDVARKIVEIDDRFFLPQAQAVAFVGMVEDDYVDKIRGFREL